LKDIERWMQTLTVLTKRTSAARDHIYTKQAFGSADMLRLLSNSTTLNMHKRHTSLQRMYEVSRSQNETMGLSRHHLWQETRQEIPMCHQSYSTSHVVLGVTDQS